MDLENNAEDLYSSLIRQGVEIGFQMIFRLLDTHDDEDKQEFIKTLKSELKVIKNTFAINIINNSEN